MKWFRIPRFSGRRASFVSPELYGTGMRISEGLQLRVKDLDFDHGTIIVREAKARIGP